MSGLPGPTPQTETSDWAWEHLRASAHCEAINLCVDMFPPQWGRVHSEEHPALADSELEEG